MIQNNTDVAFTEFQHPKIKPLHIHLQTSTYACKRKEFNEISRLSYSCMEIDITHHIDTILVNNKTKISMQSIIIRFIIFQHKTLIKEGNPLKVVLEIRLT